MITVEREKWIECINELMPLCIEVHNIDEQKTYGLELDFDSDLYIESEKNGQFHCLVMRNDGVPIGFHWITMNPLARFKGKWQACTDAIFVKPEYRRHSNFLIKCSEDYIKQLGCFTWALATLDACYRGAMWERKGFEKAETIFMKKV